MATFNVNAAPGSVQTDMEVGGGFHPGMLQGMLNWKMAMAEEMQKAKLAEMRMQMRLAQEAARNQRALIGAQLAQPSSRSLIPGGSRNDKSVEEKAREEYFKAAMTSTGSGTPGFDRYRRELMLKTLLGGGSGGGFSASPEATGAATAQAQGNEPPGIMDRTSGFNQGVNSLERTQRLGSIGGSTYVPMNPGNRYTPGDVTVPTYGPGSSRKTGGHIPEDGWYYLHEGEDVVPTPKTLRDLMVGRMKAPANNPGPGGRYQAGTSAGREIIYPEGVALERGDILELMRRAMQPEESGSMFEPSQLMPGIDETSPYAAGKGIGPIPSYMGGATRTSSFEIPEEPTDPKMGHSRGEMIVQEAERRRRMVADPDVHPEEAFAHLRGEQDRIRRASTQGRTSSPGGYLGIEGASVEELPLSERRQTASLKGQPLYNRVEAPEGQTTVKKYTIDQTARTPEEAESRRAEEDTRRAEFEDQEIERLNEAANSHAAYAAELLQYAGQNYGSPVYDAIREMAAGRLQLAQQMERAAAQRSKQRDARQAAMAESQARVIAADLEAKGRMGAADLTGRAGLQKSQSDKQTAIMNNLRGLAQSFAGIEDADPEAQEQLLREFMQAFIMLGGMQEAFGGGLPNGG